MRNLILFSVLMFSLMATASESTMSIVLGELKENETIMMVSAGDKTQIASTATRIIQLQLKELHCTNVIIISPTMFEDVQLHRFNVMSDNCSIIKKSEKCESGFSPRNMVVNPNAPGDTILGGNHYIVCIKNSQSDSKGKSGK